MGGQAASRKLRGKNLRRAEAAAPLPVVRNVSMDESKLTEIVRGVILEFAEALPEQVEPEQRQRWRANRGRAYALRLRDRMKKFGAVYHNAWFVRHAEMQEREYREEKMRAFWAACSKELEGCKDIEAFTYAVADALTSYRYGFPWEG